MEVFLAQDKRLNKTDSLTTFKSTADSVFVIDLKQTILVYNSSTSTFSPATAAVAAAYAPNPVSKEIAWHLKMGINTYSSVPFDISSSDNYNVDVPTLNTSLDFKITWANDGEKFTVHYKYGPLTATLPFDIPFETKFVG